MTAIQELAKLAVESLRLSVHEALERKRRLGQYAVVWRDGRVVRILEEDTAQDTPADLHHKPERTGIDNHES